MRSPGTASIRIALLTAALAARAWAGEPAALRAADAGLSPEFCPTLRTIVGAAASGFTSLRGPARAGGENVWEGTKRLPGSDCAVFGGTPSAYVCTLYAGDVEENADGAYDRAVSGLKDCLSDGWKTTEKVDGTHARTTTTAGGAGSTSVRVVSRDVSADAYLVEVWVDAARR
jgi:hypothetical protein